ncbi:POU-specific domain and Homeobox domain and F-box domain and Homeodomain-like and Lambda repressor-like, DNA-binding domain and POU domain-containing protein [Strongyloides ratti]|uniref:POU domain protein n=1 Tax=Strongyloides ratti TaxID=34506 RepID=A0A090KYB4_STRRB|nr:POU-specific domain and Homeobox domain and F-box domain and Homeodomain-like and Lambda repressor-like, DNA-binding domain and POU domain-containing protein [Strongyloides ratti]CEF62515.1 POU-specific domain and Homeobox domain and F-box domain and Homeodomain-like and Lambda repressor-like, DNA-binding domain and POU domain-containing protein [Strongyloides ratti]
MLTDLPSEIILTVLQKLDRKTINRMLLLNKDIYNFIKHYCKKLPKFYVDEVYIVNLKELHIEEMHFNIEGRRHLINLNKMPEIEKLADQIIVRDALCYCGNWDLNISESLLKTCPNTQSIRIFYQTEVINLDELTKHTSQWQKSVAYILVINHKCKEEDIPEEPTNYAKNLTLNELSNFGCPYAEWAFDSTLIKKNNLDAFLQRIMDLDFPTKCQSIGKYYLSNVQVSFEEYKAMLTDYFTTNSNFIFVEDCFNKSWRRTFFGLKKKKKKRLRKKVMFMKNICNHYYIESMDEQLTIFALMNAIKMANANDNVKNEDLPPTPEKESSPTTNHCYTNLHNFANNQILEAVKAQIMLNSVFPMDQTLFANFLATTAAPALQEQNGSNLFENRNITPFINHNILPTSLNGIQNQNNINDMTNLLKSLCNNGQGIESVNDNDKLQFNDFLNTNIKDNCGGRLVSPSIKNKTKNIMNDAEKEEIEEFALHFKNSRIRFGFTQGDVGQQLGHRYGTDFSQTTISRFEALNLSFKNMCKLRPLLAEWIVVTDEMLKSGKTAEEINQQKLHSKYGQRHTTMSESPVMDCENNIINSDELHGKRKSSIDEQVVGNLKKRRKRTNLDATQRDLLNQLFERDERPDHDAMDKIANHLNLDKEVIRVWFCNRRQKTRRIVGTV